MRRWRDQFPSDVVDAEVFFNEQRAQRRTDRCHRREITKRELDNPIRRGAKMMIGGMMFGLRPPLTTSRTSCLSIFSVFSMHF
jgi:hypothetical protein